MKKWHLLLYILMSLMLAGCWDQHHLVNKTFVNGIGYDLTEEGNVKVTVRTVNIKGKGGGQFDVEDILLFAEQEMQIGLGTEIDSMVAGEVDFSQAHIILIGDEMAKTGINQLLEFYYRGKDANIAKKVAITKGTAESVISTEIEKSPIAFFILQAIEGGENASYLPDESISSIWTKLLTQGRDLLLPYMEQVTPEKIRIAGVALMDGDKFSGKTLTIEQSSLLLLMMDELKKTSQMYLVLDEAKDESNRISTKQVKRKLDIEVDEKTGNVMASINLKLKIGVDSYPHNLNKNINQNELSQKISRELTKQAKEITNILQEASCDPFGIGLRVSTTYPETWEKLKWDKDFKNVTIKPNVEVEIIKTGSIY
ncbi:Ger(x)C family spore germination protein [Lysinibacillus endophyticus]|uniref:Ger(x)C family spore germination protein n=1 Tax=Ureibacillus endophyticus TaxID=1978490 RepID=UPI0031352012